jgi:hypothetical protein
MKTSRARIYGPGSAFALALAASRSGTVRSGHVAPVQAPVAVPLDARYFVPLEFPQVPGQTDLVAEAEARHVRGYARLLDDVKHEDLGPAEDAEDLLDWDEAEFLVASGQFPTPGLGSQSSDPVRAAEYINRLESAYAPRNAS